MYTKLFIFVYRDGTGWKTDQLSMGWSQCFKADPTLVYIEERENNVKIESMSREQWYTECALDILWSGDYVR